MKRKHIAYTVIGILLVLLAVWGICETAGSDSYNYEGYVLDTRVQNGDTIITTISGDKLAEFTVKWYTRQKFNGETVEIQKGNFIKLSTISSGSQNMNKFSVYDGYSKEGKLVYMEGLSSPFILATNRLTKAFELYSLISAQDNPKPIGNGIPITIYYQYPLSAVTTSVVADVIKPTSDIPIPLTQEEIDFITNAGYTPVQ